MTRAPILAAFCILELGCGRIAGIDEYAVRGRACPDGQIQGEAGCVTLPACGAHEIPTLRGQCAKVGVTSCGSGFVLDDSAGCRPVLGAAATGSCEGRELAYPGAPCGIGQCTLPRSLAYYVGSFPSGTPDGSAAYASVREALDAAATKNPDEAIQILLSPGEHRENVVLDRPTSVLGSELCHRAHLIGPDEGKPVVTLRPGASPRVAVYGLEISGGSTGIAVEGVGLADLSWNWIHDTNGPGIVFDDTLGEASGGVGAASIERTRGSGIEVFGGGKLDDQAALSIKQLNVRDVQPLLAGGPAYGIAFHASLRDDGTLPNWEARSSPSVATVQQVLIERGLGAGILIEGSRIKVDSSVVRGTGPDGDRGGRGIEVRPRSMGNIASELTLVHSLIENSYDAGIFVDNARAEITNTIIRGVGGSSEPSTHPRCIGNGLRVRANRVRDAAPAEPEVTLDQSLIEHTEEAGVLVDGARVLVVHSEISDIQPSPCAGHSADGVAAYSYLDRIELPPGLLGPRADLTLSESRVVGAGRAGVTAFGGNLTLDHALIDDCEDALVGSEDSLVNGGSTALCACRGKLRPCRAARTALEPALRNRLGCSSEASSNTCAKVCWKMLLQVERLPGVSMSLRGEPEFASSLTDVEGCADMGVSGLASERVEIARAGHWTGIGPTGFAGKSGRRALWPLPTAFQAFQFGQIFGLDPPPPGLQNGGLVNVGILNADAIDDEEPLEVGGSAGRGLPGVSAVLEQIAPANAPAPRVPAVLYAGDNGLSEAGLTATTTGTWLYAFDVPPGDYRLRLFRPDQRALSCTNDLFGDGGSSGAELPNASGEISVRVLGGGVLNGLGLLACRAAD